uniref:Uncharacterized protein n=1 Tax=Otus sunia TaxID=257818 RepID=A0A8C8AGV5_9STRI
MVTPPQHRPGARRGRGFRVRPQQLGLAGPRRGAKVFPLVTKGGDRPPPRDVVTVASKFKQRYECRLPPAAVRRQPDPEEEAQLYNGSGVTELLRPMAAAPCLVKVRDTGGGVTLQTGGRT